MVKNTHPIEAGSDRSIIDTFKYIDSLSDAFNSQHYSDIRFVEDSDINLLIPCLTDGTHVSQEEAREFLTGMFSSMSSYGCDITDRVVNAWSGIEGERIEPITSEAFHKQYEERVRTINAIKQAKGLEVKGDPYYGVLVFSYCTPILFHCQQDKALRDSIDNEDSKALCLALIQEYERITSWNRYHLPDSWAQPQDDKSFDWLAFHSLWWNSEDNAFIRYAVEDLSRIKDNYIVKQLSSMRDEYSKTVVNKYDLLRQQQKSLNADTEYGVITDPIAKYDWSTHTRMLMESHKSLFVKRKETSKTAVSDEESCYRAICNFCKSTDIEAGDVIPRFNGYGWTSNSLYQLRLYLLNGNHIDKGVGHNDFLYYFGGVAVPYLSEPYQRLKWISTDGATIMALLDEFRDCEISDKVKPTKSPQIDWKKVNRIMYVDNDSIKLDPKKHPNVYRKNEIKKKDLGKPNATPTPTPYERARAIIRQLKSGKYHDYLN